MLHVAKHTLKMKSTKTILMLKIFQFTVCQLYCNSCEIKTMEPKTLTRVGQHCQAQDDVVLWPDTRMEWSGDIWLIPWASYS